MDIKMIKQIIKKGGGIYCGIQQFNETKLFLFNNHKNKTTLSLPIEKLTTKNVRQLIEENTKENRA